MKKFVMRTFVAVEITNDSMLKSIKKIQSELKIDARPMGLQNLHFTLLFLGDTSEENLIDIKNALETVEFEPFDITFTHVGAFPRPSSPRIVWIGVDQKGAANLTNLASKVVEVLSHLGFESDKSFRSHVTIFRIKNKIGNISDDLEKMSGFVFGHQTVSEIKLKKSVLTPSGSIYSDLHVVRAR